MKKLLGILILSLLWCSNSYAAKGDGVCGLQSQLSDMTDASISIKLAAASAVPPVAIRSSIKRTESF